MKDRLVEILKNAHDEQKYLTSDKSIQAIADYLLVNGVVVLPCKVGDSCYPLNASETEFTCEEKISRITISDRNIIIGYYEHWDYYKRCRKTDTWRLPLRTRILGKGVFLTKEDAERALKGVTDNNVGGKEGETK